MRTHFASRALGLLPFLLVMGSSCSLVYDLSPDQCGSNDDCRHFGPGLQCSSGVCVCPSGAACESISMTGGSGGSGAKGGSGGTGGSTGGSTGGDIGVGGDAGMNEAGGVGGTAAVGGTGGSTGGTSGKGGTGGKGGTSGKGGTTATGGDAGSAGQGPVDECNHMADCFALKDDSNLSPYACVNHQCVQLMTDECPLILPQSADDNNWEMLKGATDPVILGGFAVVGTSLVSDYTRNYDLALRELQTKTGGVFAGGDKRRAVIMVLCDPLPKTQEELLIPGKHLMEDLQVKGIVAQLQLQDQEFLFDSLGTTDKNDVFMLMTRYSDQALINLPDNGLVWHMLSGANSLSVSVQPLVNNIELHLRNLGEVGSSEDMRAYLLKGDERFLNDLGNFFSNQIKFNGDKLASDQVGSGAFTSENVVSYLTDPSASQNYPIQHVLEAKPHLVVGATSDEMLLSILPGIEAGWEAAAGSQDRPFYLLSPLDYNINATMKQRIQEDTSVANGKTPLYQRILGFSWPAAVSQTIYNQYQLRFQSQYQITHPGLENYYDAAYYLMYAAAASAAPITGEYLRDAMIRITTGSKTVDVGPSDAMADQINAFRTDHTGKISLIGAGGPPNWDSFGGRNDPASIYCVNSGGTYVPDVQSYNPDTMLLEPAAIESTTCFDFPYTP